MSQTQRDTVKAGIFVIISGGVFVLILVVLLGRSWFRTERTFYTVFDSSVQGLEPGSPVKYLGVPAGTVSDIRFEPGNFPNIRVTIKLKDYISVKNTTRAMLVMTNLTGVGQIELVGGATQDPELGQGAFIEVQPSGFQKIAESLPKFVEKLPMTLDRVELAAQNLGKFFGDENQQKLITVIDHADASLSLFNKTLDTTSKNVIQEFSATTQDARRTMDLVRDELQKTLQEVRRLTSGDDMKSILKDMARFAEGLNSTGDKLDRLASNLETGIQSDQRALRDLLAELKQVSLGAKELIGRLRQNPSAILFASPQAEKDIPDPDKVQRKQ